MKSIYVVLLILLIGCTALKKDIIVGTTNEIRLPTESKIIFLNFKVTKNINKEIKVYLINKIIAKGNLKDSSQKKTNNTIGDFICVQFDKNLLALDSVQISNPLIKNIEYVKPSGLLGKKQIELDNAEFSTRMQLNPLTKFVSIKIINSPNSTLLEIQL